MDRSDWKFPHCYPARDVRPHDPGPEPLWNESSLLYWVDLEQGLVGFHRYGYQPNRGRANYQVAVCSTDGARFRSCEKDLVLRGDERRSDGYAIGDLAVSHTDGVSHWRFQDADCTLDLRFEEFLPRIRTTAAWGFQNSAVQEDAANHYEVPGTVTGRVRLGRRDAVVACLGYRDHSWGNRSWSFTSHRWFTGAFGPDFNFSIATAIAPAVGYFQGGYVAKDGVIDPMIVADVLVYGEDDGITARGGCVVCETKHFGRFAIEVETLDCVLLEVDHHLGCEALSRVICDGRIGIGNLECSNNPRQGRASPSLVLGAATENGLSHRATRFAPPR